MNAVPVFKNNTSYQFVALNDTERSRFLRSNETWYLTTNPSRHFFVSTKDNTADALY